MEDDGLDGVEAVEYIDSQDEDHAGLAGEKRPIMLLLRSLIRNKHNTIITNAQILDILQNEYGISMTECHELEIDIYVKVIKKYLKDWPQWEELERMATKLNTIKDFEAVTNILNHKYKNLKEYLGVMLEAAKPLAREAIESVKTIKESKATDTEDPTDVVMELQCSRDQLINLFYRHPHQGYQNSIFNISKIEPSPISLKTMSCTEIFNAWWTKILINLPFFMFKREVMHKLKHKLVNKALNEQLAAECLDTTLQMHLTPSNYNQIVDKKEIIKVLDNILAQYDIHSMELYTIIQQICTVLKKDLEDAPDKLTLPGTYRKCANKYKYVKYLYVENEQSDDNLYDIQLEETVAPFYQYFIGKIGEFEKPFPPVREWFYVECMLCNIKFFGSVYLKDQLQTHFTEQHQNEPDWQCTHCKRLFSMDYLAIHSWSHEC